MPSADRLPAIEYCFDKSASICLSQPALRCSLSLHYVFFIEPPYSILYPEKRNYAGQANGE